MLALIDRDRQTTKGARVARGKELLQETVSLLVGLVKSFGPDRLGEETVA
jgi:hypothetical protein